MMKTLAALTLAATLTARSARADEMSPPPHSSSDPVISVTTSPFLLMVPLVELTAEARVGHRFGIAAIAGAGRYHDKATNIGVTLAEGGVSARYYATGSFRGGMQLGAEATYVHASTGSMDLDVEAAGLGVSPFAGYKWTHHSGLTLEGQLGATFMVVRAKASTGDTKDDRAVLPMLNLQIGYSF